MKELTGLEIAIIGMAGRFPGAADIKCFWNNLRNGVESVSFFTDEELLLSGVDRSMVNNPSYIKANSILEDKEYFDAAFFNYRPDEARLMDPQMRIFHECIWSALEDAGCNPNDPDIKAGLFAGSSANINWELYAKLINRNGLVDDFTASQLSNTRFLATRISYFLNMHGPSIYLDTACSTSLVAVNYACKSLLLGECNVAIAGGVTITEKTRKGYLYNDDLINSRDGHCHTFDAAATGTVGGEGAGVVVLKTLKNAIKDNDHIWAVIKGTAINNDGNNKVGYTAPSINGQAEVIKMAHKWARVPAQSISYIEAHGTGTRLGDPVEVEALNQAFGKSNEKYCALGSVKTNMGHLDAAAGIAGLIKTVLALKHRQIPPSLHFQNANEAINFKDSPFYVNTKLQEWENDTYPLRAGVSAFGIGGTNAHIVLEEAPEKEVSSPGREYHLLTLSAKTPGALERNKKNLFDFLKEQPVAKLEDIAYTLQTGRPPMEYREAIICRDNEDAIRLLSADRIKQKEPVPGGRSAPLAVFMFPGQGSQYKGMCKDLYRQEIVFRAEVDKCIAIIKKQSGRDIGIVLFGDNALPGDSETDINDTVNTQPALFVVEYALARLLMHWGIQPAMMIGHSIGEYVAACISGVFSLEDSLRLVTKRGELMQQAKRGKMQAISIKEEVLMPLLKDWDGISLAAINSSELCVVSGNEESMNRFEDVLRSGGYMCRDIRTSHAFHSYMMDEILNEFAGEFTRVKINRPQIPFISNVSGGMIGENEIMKADYWVRHLRATVRFSEGIETILQHKRVVLIETGPGKVLSSLVRSNKKREKGHVMINLVRQSGELIDDMHQLISGVGELWASGITPGWENYYDGEKRQKLSLPTYSFEKVEYPVKVDAFSMIAAMVSGNGLATVQDVFLSEPAGVNESKPDIDPLPPATGIGSVEGKLTHLWQQFFGKPVVAPDDNFFEIGGDSLKALTMAGRIRKVFGMEVPMKAFFENATITQLGAYIRSASPGVDDTGLVEEYSSIPIAQKEAYYPLSPAQKRLYFLHYLDESSLAYNLPLLVWLNGPLDFGRLEKSFHALLSRHNSLRTSFDMVNALPVQKIVDSIPFKVEYYQALERNIHSLVQDFVRPFDLGNGPLIRVGIITITPGRHLFMTDLHHIIGDGISSGILMKEFTLLYNNETLPALKIQYQDYAVWLQNSGQQSQIDRQKQFWLNEFAGEINLLDLPSDFPRPMIKSYQGNSLSFEINARETAVLRTMAEKQGATMFMVVLAVYNVLLSKLANQEDIIVGTPVAGRGHADLEPIIGMFVNTLPLRNYPGGNLGFIDFLQNVKAKALAAFDNQFYPYEELIDDLKVERNTGRNPLFDVMFSYLDGRRLLPAIIGLELQPFEGEQVFAQFDLTLSVIESDESLNIDFKYATALFREETIHRFIRCFRQIVAILVENPAIRIGDIEIITAEEKQRVGDHFNDTSALYPHESNIAALFEKMVKVNGSAIAVVFEGRGITYDELNAKSNQLARKILDRGVKQESIVGILLRRSHEMIIGLLAVLKAGCAYTPIDPEYPIDRIQFMTENSGMRLMLTEPALQERYSQLHNAPETIDITAEHVYTGSGENIHIAIPSSSLAYLIYTSGSTGHPKGVMIEHRSVVNFVYGVRNRIALTDRNAILCLTTISFDIFVLETILPLLSGLKIIMAGSADQKDPVALERLVHEQRVDLLQVTPSHLKLLLAAGNAQELLRDIKILMVGGEAFPDNLLKELKGKYRGLIYNMYGPTETTVWSAIQDLTHLTAVTIGKPIANTTLRILDKYDNLQPIGIIGELCIGGDGLTRGYWKNAQLTSEKFIRDPFNSNNRLYRTGDLGQWLPDGSIVFAGRTDDQVKLRGFRIELGEIENHLLLYSGITQVTVIKKQQGDDVCLVGYYVSEHEIGTSDLRDYLSGSLPEYMIPSYFIHLGSMPLTPNGKINRKALPDFQKLSTAGNALPANVWEHEIASIWCEVLEMENIGTNVDFFSIGGNSIRLIQLFKLIDARYPKSVKVMDLFNNRTIAGLAGLIEKKGGFVKEEGKKQTTIIDF